MNELARRNTILEVADKLLRHYGLHKTTVADVAKEANVSVGSVYLEFPSKDAIIAELSLGYYTKVLESMRRAAEPVNADSIADKLIRVLESRAVGFIAMLDAGTHACDLFHCSNSAVTNAQGVYYEQERRLLRDILMEGRANGEFSMKDVDLSLRALLIAYAPFGPPRVFKVDQRSLGADIGAMHDLVLNGLRKRQ